MALFPELTDAEAWSQEDLEVLRQAVLNEIDRRLTIVSAEQQIDELVRQYSAATGRKDGDSWVQPTGAHDSYPDRSRVTHNGTEWYSTIPGNVWEPGVSGWREYVVPDSGVVPDFLAPTGAHDAYMVGDRVTFQGRVYESVIDSNVYSPVEYAQGWVEIDPNAPVEVPEVPDESEPEPAPDAPVESEPEPEVPAVPEWKQPTGGHDTYAVGDRVLFEGSVYESVIAGNSWSPTGYPAGWKKI